MPFIAAAARPRLLLGGILTLLAPDLLPPRGGGLLAQTPFGAERVPGVSKQMSLAIEHYEKGEDLEAMDRFMDVLTKGDPSERPMANEYMNLITQRMALGAESVRRPSPTATFTETIRSERLASAGPRPANLFPDRAPGAGAGGAEGLPPRQSQDLSKADREVMKREIEGKIQNRTRLALSQLRKYEEIQIHMSNSRIPRAIGMPASLLFGSGSDFKKDAGKIVDALVELAFSLGATQLVILPEKAMISDAKILDMRRAMGLGSQLFKAGVAPPRVRVNLLPNQVDVPREMQDYQGMIVAFIYNQPLLLSTDAAIDGEGGPPISLGVFPGSLDPRRSEGSIVELSVVEPPAGLMSWRFQLRAERKRPGEEMSVLQEIKGTGPVFHQIYWNGRKNYFGEALPAGRYECVLTATDMKNRARTKHEWITVEGIPSVEIFSAVRAPRIVRAGAPPSELSGASPKRVTIGEHPRAARRKKTKARAVPLVKKKAVEEPPRQPPAAAQPEQAAQPPAAAPSAPPAKAPDPESPRSNQMVWVVQFSKNSPNMTPEGEGTIGKVFDTMALYPLDGVKLLGFAGRGEPDAESLAAHRADIVANQLANKYKMDPKRIQKDHKVVETESYKVEISQVTGK